MEPKCCGCCCPIVQGLQWYSGIFCAVVVIGVYNYMPAPRASFGFTFAMSSVIDDAEKFCDSSFACDAVCARGPCEEVSSGNVSFCGEGHDMEALSTTRTAGQALAFFAQLCEVAAFGTCLLGALTRSAKTLKAAVVAIPGAYVLFFIAYILISAASPVPIFAWYLYHVLIEGNVDDEEAECTQDWVDDATAVNSFGLGFLWVGFCITAAVSGHIAFTAWAARRFLLHGAPTNAVHPSTAASVQVRALPPQGVVSGVPLSPMAASVPTATGVAVPIATATAVAVPPGASTGAVATAVGTAIPMPQ